MYYKPLDKRNKISLPTISVDNSVRNSSEASYYYGYRGWLKFEQFTKLYKIKISNVLEGLR